MHHILETGNDWRFVFTCHRNGIIPFFSQLKWEPILEAEMVTTGASASAESVLIFQSLVDREVAVPLLFPEQRIHEMQKFLVL